MTQKRAAVLLVGFGGPESLDEVPAFVESVLGRTPPDHVTSGAVGRYRAIGGKSPLPDMTRRQAELVESALSRRGRQMKVHVGMLHALPTIGQSAASIIAEGVEELVVISLAPYRCQVSTDAYEAAVVAALDGGGPRLRFAHDWNLHPGYIGALADMLGKALAEAPDDVGVVFAAHSLPVRMIDQGDPYVDQLLATAAAVAGKLGLVDWALGYQSVSAAAREPWLRPSVDEVMVERAGAGAQAVLVDPIGFLADHVETLYDNDIEHRAQADELGIGFHRCLCLNDHPALIETLADLVVATADGE